MRWLLLLLSFAILTTSADAERASFGAKQALFADGRVWLISGDNRALVSFRPDADDEVVVAFESGAMAQAYVGGFLWSARSAPPESGGGVGLSRFERGAWRLVARLIDSDLPDEVSFTVVGNQPVLAGHGFVWRWDGARWRKMRIDAPMPAHRFVLGAAGSGDLYVGADAGEFGGGLARVRPSADRVEMRCGAFASLCLPITKIVADPADPVCVYVAASLQHMWQSAGRVARVCEDKVSIIFERALPRTRAVNTENGDEAVLDMAVSSRGVWVETPHGLYLVSNGQITPMPTPVLHHSGSLMVGRAPGLIVVGTGETSGIGVPPYLLAPTD